MAEKEKSEREKVEKDKKAPSAQQLREMLAQFQVAQQQLQAVVLQRESSQMRIEEINKAQDELSKVKDKDKSEVYKVSGTILVKTNADAAKKDLADEKDNLEVRVKALEKQEAALKTRINDLQAKLQAVVGQAA